MHSLFKMLLGNAAAATYSGGGNFNGLNGGTGFGNFSVSPSSNGGTSGAFIGSSNGNGDGSGGTGIGSFCWALYANSGNTAAAVRPFSNPLNPGATLSFGFDNGFIDNGGTVGFGIQNSSGENLVEYYYIGGDGVNANGRRGKVDGDRCVYQDWCKYLLFVNYTAFWRIRITFRYYEKPRRWSSACANKVF